MNLEQAKKEILNFTIKSVEQFLKENPELTFYAFAYDCNIEYGEINLCFNTEKDFQDTFKHYYPTVLPENYKNQNDYLFIRYNTGDWEYQCFDTFYIMEEEIDKKLNEIIDFDEKTDMFLNQLLNFFHECLVDFTQTETYKKIPKTEDFIAYTIDHDEDIESALERQKNFKYHHIKKLF